MRIDLTELVRLDRRLHRASRFLLLVTMLSGSVLLFLTAVSFYASGAAAESAVGSAIVALLVLTTVPFTPVLLCRPLRFANRGAAWIVGLLVALAALVLWLTLLFAAQAIEVIGGAQLVLVLLVGAYAVLLWPIVSGVLAVRRVHRYDFAGLIIDAVECIRYRTQDPLMSWSPRKLSIAGLLVFAPVLYCIVVVAVLSAFHAPGWLYVLLLGSVGVAYRTWPLARRRWQASAAEARRRDGRAPVLLLRSFQDDVLELPARLSSRLLRRDLRHVETFEEVLTGQLWARGPVIAIGRPGESAPPIGAARDYFSDETWQAEAERMARDCQMIVMIVGATEGLGWEMRRVYNLKLLPKLALVVPPVAPEESRARWNGFREMVADLPIAAGIVEAPAEELTLTVYREDEEPVFFTVRGRRDSHAYQLALAAAAQAVTAAVPRAPNEVNEAAWSMKELS